MTDLFLRVSQGLTGLIIIMYGVGYLVASLFYGSWGINASGLELIRAHYIHIGFLCLTPPLVLGGVHYSGKIVSARQLLKRDGSTITWTRPGKYAFMALPTGLYLIALLGERSQILFNPFIYLPMVLLPISVIAFLTVINRVIANYARVSSTREFVVVLADDVVAKGECTVVPAPKVGVVVRYALQLKYLICIFSWSMVGCICYAIWDTLYDLIVFQHMILGLYVMLAILFAMIAEINIENIVLVVKTNMRPLLALGGLCVFVPLGYFMVIAFTFSVFPYIPAGRGGANYLEAMPVELEIQGLKREESIGSASNISPALATFIIEEIGDLMYFGTEEPDSMASEWRHRKKRPKVTIVNKKELKVIRFLGA